MEPAGRPGPPVSARFTRARTTKDIDLLWTAPLLSLELHQTLVRSALTDLSDWFQRAGAQSTAELSLRFPVRSFLDGRPFEAFHLDVGHGDPVLESTERLSGPPRLEFAEIVPVRVPCYPLTHHIAEKVHAYTRPYASGESTRIKDWADILLTAAMGTCQAQRLRRALRATFEARQTRPLPQRLPLPPADCEQPFRQLHRVMPPSEQTLASAADALARIFDPILRDERDGDWNPVARTWS